MTVKEWLVHTFKEKSFGMLIRRPAVCEDGFEISIQASRSHYCCPRATIDTGDYTHVELGYPSQNEELLEQYREGTIYPYVPIELVEEMIKKHGGIV